MKHLLATFLVLVLGVFPAWGFPQNPDQYNPAPNNPPANNPTAYNPAPSLQRPISGPPVNPPAYNPAPNNTVTYNPPVHNPPTHNPPANNPSPTYVQQQTNPTAPEFAGAETPNRRPQANPLAILNAPRPRISLPLRNRPPEEVVPQQSFPPERKWSLPPLPFDPPKDPPAVENTPVLVTGDRPPFDPPKGN